jgi:hypothetical protein
VPIEQPPFTVIRSDGRIELRCYDPFIVAETVVEDAGLQAGANVGFRRLAGFIFGGNSAEESIAMTAPVTTTRSERIAMTAPVETQRSGQGVVMRFMMPSQYTVETLPKPNDPRVQIRQVPGRTMAAIRFSGRWGEERFEERTEELLTWLQGRQILVVGTPVVARYNPPWTPGFLRRNEVLVEIRVDS